jgi:hypothetical protein
VRKWVYNGVEFREGDIVKVVRIEEDEAPNGMGEGVAWNNAWINTRYEDNGTIDFNMDGYFGMEFTIEDISVEGVYFENDPAGYAFPLSSLEKVVQLKEVA